MISGEVAKSLQDNMQRVPESIDRLCAQIMELYEHAEIDRRQVQSALVKLLDNREGRYASYRGSVHHPPSKSFLGSVGLSSRTVALAVKRLRDPGVLEQAAHGYRIADPLLAAYLRRYR